MATEIQIIPGKTDTLVLQFPYDANIIEKIKTIPGRRFDAAMKTWEVPDNAETHELLKSNFGIDPEKGKQDPISLLANELKLRNYSRQTIKNYTSLVSRFLQDSNKSASQITIDDIKTYLLALQNAGTKAPRTINLTAAAISFFFANVLKKPINLADVPRMKTGRELPCVYSQEDIGKILSSTSNPKHILILILAYGCGLRLNEIIH